MPTPIDRAIQQRAPLLAFAGIVTAVAAWTIWAPESTTTTTKAPDPTGEPESWTRMQLGLWLNNRRILFDGNASKDDLLKLVKRRMKKDAPAT